MTPCLRSRFEIETIVRAHRYSNAARSKSLHRWRVHCRILVRLPVWNWLLLTVRAIVWSSDMRDYSSLSEQKDNRAVAEVPNSYFPSWRRL